MEKKPKLENTNSTNNENKTTNAKKIQASRIKIPLDTVVPVTCNVFGGLYYESRNGDTVADWSEYGSTEYLELSDIVTMRNYAKRFFEDNWIILEDTDEYTSKDLYSFLKVDKLYSCVLYQGNIDRIFKKEPREIIKIISTLSKGMKDTIAIRAKILIDSGELDSRNRINALESALNVQFEI